MLAMGNWPLRMPAKERRAILAAGYSSAGCSPAGSASASPTVYEFALVPSCRSRDFHRTVKCVLNACVVAQPKCI